MAQGVVPRLAQDDEVEAVPVDGGVVPDRGLALGQRGAQQRVVLVELREVRRR